MNRTLLAALAVSLDPLGSSCASLTAARADLLMVSSTPPGAEVRVDGAPLGLTPMAVAIDRLRPGTVEVVAGGHAPQRCSTRMSPGATYLAGDIVLCVLLFPVGCVSFIDAAGAWNVLDRPSCNAVLQPLEPGPVGPPPVVMPPPPLPPMPTAPPAP